mgnify:CR=1 FL=1
MKKNDTMNKEKLNPEKLDQVNAGVIPTTPPQSLTVGPLCLSVLEVKALSGR